jgi:uncharacterized protein YutE (UPF0331/DUF86 family)
MRVNDKIGEIEQNISELEEIMPSDIKEYNLDFKTRAACERYFERIIESVVDVAFLIIKDKGYKIPEEDKEAFDILAQEKIISSGLSKKLMAKGMRNILAHEYGKVDDEIIFNSITEELVNDVREFIRCIINKI